MVKRVVLHCLVCNELKTANLKAHAKKDSAGRA